MGKRHKPPRRLYPLDQSRLYKCRSRARLASLLNLSSVSELEALANDGEATYRAFTTHEKGKSPRAIQYPIAARERVHLRLFHLMRRIETPDYLHSGISGRSNVTNAKVHVGHHPLFKTDIKSFYESTTAGLINRVFRDSMQCSPDVSAVLTRLCTVNGHVPTGSSLSQLLAFYAVKPRLDEFAAICKKRGVTLSVYVDDITISGDRASRWLLYQLKRLLAKDGYTCHKNAQYRAADAKIVTGVVVTARGVRVRNKQHQRIYEELRALLGREPDSLDEKNYERLQGRIASASQIDATIIEQKRRLNSWKKYHRQSHADVKEALDKSGFVGCGSGEPELSRNYKNSL